MRLTLLAALLGLLAGGPVWADDAARIAALKQSGWAETDFSKLAVDLSEVMAGGPPKDGIPSIDKPRFAAADTVRLNGREPVIVFGSAADRRAYPLQVLIWHEIVNDVVDGKPVVVTYCPLCNAAIVLERTVEGRVLDFGTTGLLRNSDLVMYDRQTQSWWQQFTGEAIAGAMTGKTLVMLPSRLESFDDFKVESPAGKVLVPENPAARPYGHNPYVSYDSATKPFLYHGPLPEGIPAMARVVVVRGTDPILAVSLELLRQHGRIAKHGLTLTWHEGQASALDSPIIAEGAESGTVIVQRNGEDVPYDVTFAFVLKAFHPDVTIMTQ
ncbi:MAG: DUF3179 domain-containing protein [Hyphomicrobiales bacterium]